MVSRIKGMDSFSKTTLVSIYDRFRRKNQIMVVGINKSAAKSPIFAWKKKHKPRKIPARIHL